jgi:hypothetical protein
MINRKNDRHFWRRLGHFDEEIHLPGRAVRDEDDLKLPHNGSEKVDLSKRSLSHVGVETRPAQTSPMNSLSNLGVCCHALVYSAISHARFQKLRQQI